MGKRYFSVEEVLQLRQKWDAGVLDVREAARFAGVTPETIRRIGRRDTYCEIGDQDFRSQDHRSAFREVQEVPDQRIAQSLGKLQGLLNGQGEREAADRPPTGLAPATRDPYAHISASAIERMEELLGLRVNRPPALADGDYEEMNNLVDGNT